MWMGRFFAMAAALAGTVAVAQVPGPRTAPLAPASVIATTPTPAMPPARDLNAADVTAWLDGYMPYALHAGDIAGAVVMVVKDGQIVASRGYGYADVAKRTPVDPARTLFRPGSTSKLVTWTAVMQLVEAGKLDLDRDVNTYIDFRIPPRGGKPVTLRQIMTHTAGFEEVQKDIIFDDREHNMPLAAYLKRWVPVRIFDAGTTPAYSNYATAIAGYIVGRVSGEPFEDYVERHIFAPLDMRTASFRQPLPPALRPLSATGYGRASEPGHPFEFVGPAPAGSLSASGLDMAKFMIAHLDDGRGILKPETARMMHASPLDHVDPASLIPPLNRMELGFFETNVNDREVIAHLGDTNWFHTSLHLFLAERTGLYVSFNSVGRDGAVGALRQQLFQDFADRYFPATKPDGRVDAATAASHAKAMAGRWESSRRSQTNFFDILNLFGQAEISVDDKVGLVVPALKTPGGAVRRWDEIAPFVWREHGGHERLAAKLADGQVIRWSFDLVAPFMVYDRVPLARSGAWILPALYASLAVLLLTFLYWPVTWAIRRRYATAAAATGPALHAYRATRIMALLDLAVLGGWTALMSAMMGDTNDLTSATDIWAWLLQIGGAIIFVGAVGIAGWNTWLSWRDGRRWPRRLWSLIVLLATLVVLYVAATFHLLAMTVNY